MRAQTTHVGLFSVLPAPLFPNATQPIVVDHNLAMQYKPQSVIKKKNIKKLTIECPNYATAP